MTYNFDELIPRQHTSSMKWQKYAGQDIVPLWVADMDFRCSKPIIEAMNQVNEHGILGYTLLPDELAEVVVQRLQEQHHWKIEKEWLLCINGLVAGLNLACRAVGQEGDDVMTLTPVYGPFMSAPKNAKRNLVKVPVTLQNQRWTINFEALEAAITPRTRLFQLCNPHNPAGTVFTKDELQKLGNICIERGIVICSDEIHCDLILDESKQHISIATLSPEIEQNSITLISPSKTFNIAGLGCSFAIIPNKEIRQRFQQEMFGISPMLSAYAYQAALAAYRDSGAWYEQMMNYLRSNYQYVFEQMNAIEGFEMMPLDATFLAWIDTRKRGIDNIGKFLETAGVGISDGGEYFDGKGFIRLNFGTPRSVLETAIKRMKSVL